jgi:hypothetical protein
VDAYFLGTTANPIHGERIALAGGGDANGDGYTDLLIGQPHYVPSEPEIPIHTAEGAAHLLLGGMISPL